MKQFNLIYSPNDSEMYLFNDLDLSKLSEPLTIEREEQVQEEEQVFEKKKSEVVEYEDENYVSLREREQDPFVIVDCESRTMCGKFQNISDSASMYFALINVGNSLRVVPISKWYRFVQKNQFSEGDVDGLEKNLGHIEIETEESESQHEIDYDNVFDDDDGDMNEVYVYKEKELSTSGRKMQGLVECYEENINEEVKEEAEEKPEAVENAKKAKVDTEYVKKLTNDDIRRAFKGRKISVKDLLLNLRSNFKMDESEKNLIRNFLKESCTFETDSVTGDKIFKLKK
ncbi:uncharacterized protein VICG_00439 [Vittaforma corneae ATCC 50505]|uniref:Transcription initiation factor IIF subunit alpha n=1 Tax=Vittaforma corneae (strain ATCC 50505) TaxID=993615 RepID=L2GNC6_VITCO|nr:uncharacterized protein VICG_00439 [Vittaforma corneae ATCC 50505]ELA42341.1 hypothetical protein VICG_00439 [Vittaforma corneae ATCC 50505]